MLSDAPLIRSRDEVSRRQTRDPIIVDGTWGGLGVARRCHTCGGPEKVGRNAIGVWVCMGCGRSLL